MSASFRLCCPPAYMVVLICSAAKDTDAGKYGSCTVRVMTIFFPSASAAVIFAEPMLVPITVQTSRLSAIGAIAPLPYTHWETVFVLVIWSLSPALIDVFAFLLTVRTNSRGVYASPASTADPPTSFGISSSASPSSSAGCSSDGFSFGFSDTVSETGIVSSSPASSGCVITCAGSGAPQRVHAPFENSCPSAGSVTVYPSPQSHSKASSPSSVQVGSAVTQL